MNESPLPNTPAAAPPPFRITERARWSDVDAAGIVCYGAYLRFFELAETELFRAGGLTVARLQQEYRLWLVRRRVECDFHRPITLDEEVEVFASVPRIGHTSLELAFQVRRLGDDAPAAEARYFLVAVGHETLRPVPVPGAVREALARWQVEGERRGAPGGVATP
jgi:YbgC/YbaW family acyl-CoA thioester hydrolase